jgi:hypothetical protein
MWIIHAVVAEFVRIRRRGCRYGQNSHEFCYNTAEFRKA